MIRNNKVECENPNFLDDKSKIKNVEVLNSIFYCPLGCGRLEEGDNCLFNHFKHGTCKKLKLLKNKTYSACMYNAYHIIKTDLLEEHYKNCRFNCKNFNYINFKYTYF